MDDKKKIIMKEIMLWKENHMLPEHYCDYLLALYSQGEEISEQAKPPARNRRIKAAGLFLSFLLLIISLFVIYFTELSFPLQTAILTTFVVFLLEAGIYFSKKGMLMPIIYVASALIFLLFSVELNAYAFENNPFSLYGLVFANCLLWWYAGSKLKLIYFVISAWIGILTLIIFILI
ncbi:hypothetical protein JOC78_002997 [Bacillus ectoiniformans]|uniref:hypothetical protein n=1 Tax=Bacillus ectoiniformans TaxID=1494429 RepID=UPI001959024A|nr:hypothetical protein [Bacillus ectoiniformans]MBM7650013.1 hypothetical protein [Bacillus ectoiniformans]